MLNIENYYKLIGSAITTPKQNYLITEVGEVEIVGNPAYEFKVNLYGKDREVTLYKNSKNERYELFIMGWHTATLENIKISEIKDAHTFLAKMGLVLDKLKEYIDINGQ
jgi:hypothetical protein